MAQLRYQTMLALRCMLILFSLAITAAREAKPINGAFIVKLTPEVGSSGGLSARTVDQHELFHKRAAHLDYTIRHEFKNEHAYLGLSLRVASSMSSDAARSQLEAIPGVLSVTPVYEVHLIKPPGNVTDTPAFSKLSYSNPAPLNFPNGDGNLAGALQMSGADKLHALGIKGRGVKVGIIDTGVDYRHPALGGGFGNGYKIAGGYSWVSDDGTLINTTDPLATCYGGAHGSHVAGIIGMNPLLPPFGLPISGVAPEASLYMYRVFDCNTHSPGSDYILAAMLKTLEDGMDVVSMSLAIGLPPINGLGDPLAEVTEKLYEAGIGVVVAMANNGLGNAYANNIYSEEWPSTEPGAIGVGAVANGDFPLVYSVSDSRGAKLSYASIWPVAFQDLDVYHVDDGCSANSWEDAFGVVQSAGQLNKTIFDFEVNDNCRPSSATVCCTRVLPKYVLGYWANTTDVYNIPYNLPNQARIGTTQFIAMSVPDSSKLTTNFAAAGGNGKYKLKFPKVASYSSPTQNTGGMVDYYSSFGPVRLKFNLKPQISAPGGNILSTYPLGTYGGYGILSGTSMATPYIAGCYALVKSQFPKATPGEIIALLQTTGNPMPWIFDQTMLSATQQQGGGLVNVFKAITARSQVSPGEILASDLSKTLYGVANITITNKSLKPKSYAFSHQGAGYMSELLGYQEISQRPIFGAAQFSPSSVEVAPGKSVQVAVKILPPSNVDTASRPVFGGYVKVHDTDGEEFGVPYSGPPFSLYNTDSITIKQSATASLPGIHYDLPSGNRVWIKNFLEVNKTMKYGSSTTYDLWTECYRIDILPANTTIMPTHFGFDNSTEIEYIEGSTTPRSSFLGFESYGNLKKVTGLLSPANNFSPSGTGLFVTGDDGVEIELGAGDYRWLYSIQRWGGEPDIPEDWETWLGPMIRVKNGPV